MSKYSLYCTQECAVGKPQSDKFLAQNNSAFDAAIDMQNFVDRCQEGGCKYEKERIEFDKKEGEK